jgi:hypothetical protein
MATIFRDGPLKRPASVNISILRDRKILAASVNPFEEVGNFNLIVSVNKMTISKNPQVF